MIVLLCGEDLFQVRQHLDSLKEEAARQEFGIVDLDAEEATAERFRDAIFSRSLFVTDSAIFMKNLFSKGSAELKEAVLRIVEVPPAHLSLVLWEEGLPDRRTKLFHVLGKRATLVEKRFLNRFGLIQWIRDQVKTRELSLSPGAVEVLVSLVGPDLFRMTNELEKLAAYGGGQPLDEAAVRSLVEASLPPTIFEFLDAASTRSPQAIVLANQLMQAGEDPLHLLSMVAYQVRNLLTVQDFLGQQPGAQSAEITRRFGWHPFVAQKTLQQSRTFSKKALLTLHTRLTELDTKLKTGETDPADAVFLLVTARA